jgi:hypothetical protein
MVGLSLSARAGLGCDGLRLAVPSSLRGLAADSGVDDGGQARLRFPELDFAHGDPCGDYCSHVACRTIDASQVNLQTTVKQLSPVVSLA